MSQVDEYGKLLSEIIRDKARNELILEHLLKEADQGHSILVLSRRVAHVKHLCSEFGKPRSKIPAAVVVGATPKEEREGIIQKVGAGQIKVLFSCLICDEGLDLPILSRLFIVGLQEMFTGCSSRWAVSKGRTRRKPNCAVLDFWDKHTPLSASMLKSKLHSFYENFEVVHHGYQ